MGLRGSYNMQRFPNCAGNGTAFSMSSRVLLGSIGLVCFLQPMEGWPEAVGKDKDKGEGKA